ncbi:MAG: hypothetical protein ACOX83_09450 [Candidatus Spyradocola sp.]
MACSSCNGGIVQIPYTSTCPGGCIRTVNCGIVCENGCSARRYGCWNRCGCWNHCGCGCNCGNTCGCNCGSTCGCTCSDSDSTSTCCSNASTSTCCSNASNSTCCGTTSTTATNCSQCASAYWGY